MINGDDRKSGAAREILDGHGGLIEGGGDGIDWDGSERGGGVCRDVADD